MSSAGVTVLLLLPLLCYCVELPDYVEKCNIRDPDIAVCIMDRFEKVKPYFVEGVKELNIPKLNPFHLSKIAVEATKTLNVTLTDVDIFGLENAICKNTTADLKTMKGSVTLLLPTVHVRGHYDISGSILFLPISGNGPASMNITNAQFWLKFSWKLVEKDGVKYASIVDADLKYKTDRTQYRLENLFNGNKALGDEMNAFINENWKEFSKEIEPAVSQTLLKVIWNIYDGIGKAVPYDSLFLP